MERNERRRADALDRYWDATQRGGVPRRPSDVDQVAATVVDHLGGSPAPPDMNAARLRVRQRIVAAARTKEETMHASALPIQGFGRTWMPPAAGNGPARKYRPKMVARLALLALLLLILAAAGVRFGSSPPKGGEPANLPAAVALATPAATPTVALYPKIGHAIVGVWQWDYSPCNPGFVAHSVFNDDGSYVEYTDRGGLTVGTWRATGERSVEVVSIDLELPSFDAMFGVEENLPLPTEPIVKSLASFYSIELGATGTSFVARGFYEPRGPDGEVLVHFEYADDCGFEMHGTKVVPESVATPIRAACG